MFFHSPQNHSYVFDLFISFFLTCFRKSSRINECFHFCFRFDLDRAHKLFDFFRVAAMFKEVLNFLFGLLRIQSVGRQAVSEHGDFIDIECIQGDWMGFIWVHNDLLFATCILLHFIHFTKSRHVLVKLIREFFVGVVRVDISRFGNSWSIEDLRR